jgi:hypothetical protein
MIERGIVSTYYFLDNLKIGYESNAKGEKQMFQGRVAFKKVRIDIQDNVLKQADLTKKDTTRQGIRFYFDLFLWCEDSLIDTLTRNYNR